MYSVNCYLKETQLSFAVVHVKVLGKIMPFNEVAFKIAIKEIKTNLLWDSKLYASQAGIP